MRIVGLALAFGISYYWFESLIPKEPIVILEVESLKTAFEDAPAYSLTGAVADKSYLLETVKIYPNSDNVVKQAKFQYDVYPHIDLVKSQGTTPYYGMSKDSLQKTLGEDAHFSYQFLTNERFAFYFQFEGVDKKKPEFECKIFTADKLNVPCVVKEKGYLSLLRGIPWGGLGILLGVIWILLLEIIYLFIKRERDDVF